ncbi:MAG TPA: J domain-containing protein [Cellvibrionaceae bacterium]|nr:J domain-containing protein [Cellvibrionaceae bacterium]HMW72345.1 J domain-containing protein [Cellvibrionaceae bacterium]HMY38056.1 J domain-containing protein [Marinagarivorans sp.]HNG60409.1 J domain-containing protein [Cellvibrionaceae bacterium]
MNNSALNENNHWVIWNGAYGIVDTVTIERTQRCDNTTLAWLDEPYDMVGPFNFDALQMYGAINYQACLIMSAEKWQQDQVHLRRESIRLKREAMVRAYEQQARFNQRRHMHNNSSAAINEKALRQTLNLPAEGTLTKSHINAAYRRLAQKTHPDHGGNQEEFVRVTQARDRLLEIMAT